MGKKYIDVKVKYHVTSGCIVFIDEDKRLVGYKDAHDVVHDFRNAPPFRSTNPCMYCGCTVTGDDAPGVHIAEKHRSQFHG